YRRGHKARRTECHEYSPPPADGLPPLESDAGGLEPRLPTSPPYPHREKHSLAPQYSAAKFPVHPQLDTVESLVPSSLPPSLSHYVTDTTIYSRSLAIPCQSLMQIGDIKR